MSELIVVDFNPRVPKYISRLLPFIDRDFDEVVVFSNKKKLFNELSPKVRFKGVNCYSEHKFVKFISYVYNWISLLFYCYINANKINVIHFQFLPLYEYMNCEIYLLKLLKKITPNLFYTVHNLLPHDSNQNLTRWMKLYSQFSCLFVHDEHTKSVLLNHLGNSVIVAKVMHPPLYKSTNKKKYFPNNIRPLKLLLFGFLEPYKGCETYLQLAKSFVEDTDFEFLIAGQIRDEYRVFLSSKNLLDLPNVTYKFGYLSDVELQNQISDCDIILFPFDRITTSGSFMSVLNQFKCVIANNLPFFREVLEDDRLQICDCSNFIELQYRLNYLNRNREMIRELGENNFRIVNKKYSWEMSGRQHLFFYKN